MLMLLIITIVLGIILETISLRREPDILELDFLISSVTAEPGTPFTTQIVIVNKSRLPVSYVAFREIYPPEAVITGDTKSRVRHDGLHVKKICRVGGRRRVRLIQEVSIEKRGVYTFRGESVEIGDFLGFREIEKSVFFKRELVVFPQKLDCPRLIDTLGDFLGDVSAKRFLIRDPMLTVGYREYTGREPMRDIHWLQSARQNGLMVREFDYTRQLSVSVILGIDEMSAPETDELDNCCAVSRAVCETLADMGVSVSFFTNSVLKNKSLRGFWKCEVSRVSSGGLPEGLGRVCEFTRGPLEGLFDYVRRSCGTESAFVLIVPGDKKRAGDMADWLRSVTGGEVLLIDAESEVSGSDKRMQASV